jgi:thioesterase-3
MISTQVFEYPLMIRESQVDTLGHINNATYLVIFEDARWDLITKNGFGLKEVHEKMVSPVILEINIKYLKEVRARTNAVVKTQSIDFQGKIGKLKQTLELDGGVAACEAIVTYGVFDLRTRKLILPTPEWLKAIGGD